MSIRKLALADLSFVQELMEELNKALNEQFDVTQETLKEQFYEMSKYQEIYENYVYEIDGRIIGFISLLHYRSFFHKKGTTLINELIVGKNYRNRNIGKNLLEYAINRSRNSGMDEIEVGVMKGNKKGLDFYKKNGMDEEYILLGKEN